MTELGGLDLLHAVLAIWGAIGWLVASAEASLRRKHVSRRR